MAQFFVVVFDEPHVVAAGKGSSNIISHFTRVLTKLQVPAEVLPFRELIERGPTTDPKSYVLLHYNELFVVQHQKVDWLRARETELAALGHKVLHSVEHGRVIGHKVRQNKVLTAAGVPMPRLIEAGDSFGTVFSNEVSNAHVPVQLVSDERELDSTRYNTDYINCKYEYKGKPWHVSIRAMAVGEQVLFSWIRAGKGLNVRTRGTPVDAEMLTHLHDLLIKPNIDQIRDIAKSVKNAVGVGLYAHDILPCAETGKFFLCETNFKFYEGMYRFHMQSIAKELPTPAYFNGRTAGRRIARALVHELDLQT
ncbi:hypothetical protein [Ruegeria arenilitoris]|uniref:hypothetical protein n=1 Tax=Ruegeria arenilitoris TaxID=1173585 RepID=UPI00148182B9|nr:hypothetical protein [Ruegeria arenilitoris]